MPLYHTHLCSLLSFSFLTGQAPRSPHRRSTQRPLHARKDHLRRGPSHRRALPPPHPPFLVFLLPPTLPSSVERGALGWRQSGRAVCPRPLGSNGLLLSHTSTGGGRKGRRGESRPPREFLHGKARAGSHTCRTVYLIAQASSFLFLPPAVPPRLPPLRASLGRRWRALVPDGGRGYHLSGWLH